MAELTPITRRILLKAAPAVGLAAVAGSAVGAIAQPPEGETEIARLFREWEAAEVTCRTGTEAEFDVALLARCSAEAAIMTTAPTSISDMALKIIVADDNGDMENTLVQVELVREAFQITGASGWTDERQEALERWRETNAA